MGKNSTGVVVRSLALADVAVTRDVNPVTYHGRWAGLVVGIEFQPAGALSAGPTKPLSEAIFNYGFADRWELVLQGTAQVLPEAAGPLSVSNGAFLKYVLVPGALQGKQGPSVATEFGPLLPPAGGSGVGFSWPGIEPQ